MAKTIKLVTAQGVNDAYTQASKRLGSRRLVKILRMYVDIDLAGALADTHQFEVCLTNSSQATMPGFNDANVIWKKKITIAGAPAGAQEPSWEAFNLPPFEASEIFVSIDTANTGGSNTATFTIYYDDSRKAY